MNKNSEGYRKWANAYMRTWRQRPENKAKIKAHRARPEVKQRSLEYHQEYRKKNREKMNAIALAYLNRNREKVRANQREYISHPEIKAQRKATASTPEARIRARTRQSAYRKANRDHVTELRRQNYQKLRLAALTAYGNKCVCCGETRHQFLSFDHINGGGKKDRQTRGYGEGGSNWYRFLITEHPDHVQILCHNCNMAKGHYGICPHQEGKESLRVPSILPRRQRHGCLEI